MTRNDDQPNETMVLTRKDVERLATMALAVEAVERAFAAFGRREAVMPPKVYLSLTDLNGDFRAMPSRFGDVAGIKWVNVHPGNPQSRALPSVMGTFVLNDARDGFPLAIMDGTWLTALRTGAAAAVASKHLADGSPGTIGFVGAGVQARTLFGAHRAVYGEFETLVYDRDPSAADALARETGGQAVSLPEACGADILCTATPSRTPLVDPAWIRPGGHINAMGADAPGKQELQVGVLKAAAVYVDDIVQAEKSGEINVPVHDGDLSTEDLAGTLGEVVVGRLPRPRPDETTVFDSTGLAVQDVALAKAIYEAARAQGVGIALDLVGAG